MARLPDIPLTEKERKLLEQIAFSSKRHEDLRASIMPMVALSESLLKRGVIPEARLLYFTDPERNPGGRGKSRKDIFEKNGTSEAEILAHPNFLKYLEYFVFGPNLPAAVIDMFRDAAKTTGYLSSHDIRELTPQAKVAARGLTLESTAVADEFHKLALECGATPDSASTLRQVLRAIRR